MGQSAHGAGAVRQPLHRQMSDAPVWEDGAWASLPVLQGDLEADVCVVGLGGSGLACILELLSLGQRVIGIDAASVGGGAAGRNGGFLLAGLPSFYHQAAEKFGRERSRTLYRKTLAELDRMTQETPAAIRRVGSLRIAEDAAELADCVAQVALMRADGLPGEAYDGPEGQGILIPTDGAFNPLQRCRTLAQAASSGGARLFEQSAAIDIAGHLVRTRDGSVRCTQVVVAVDGRLEVLLPELQGRVRTARLQMVATAPVKNVHFPRPVYQRWGYEYWQQLPDGRIALGGLRDRAGDVEWTDAAVTTEDLQRGLDLLLRERLRVSAPITHRWAGVVGYSSSGLPIVEEVRPSVWAIGGYNGTGNVLGALCGRGVAQLVVHGKPGLLPELLPA